MKAIGSKKILSISTVIIILLVLPVLANASAVPWSTETYRAYTYAEYNSGQIQQETFGPPLPISAYSWADPTFVYSSSNITSSDMNIWSHTEPVSYMSSGNADAIAEFSGTFTAVDPSFQFIYSYTYDAYGGTSAQYSGNDKFWISVYDTTDSVYLYNYTLNFTSDGSASDVLNINTHSGHEINVDFGIQVESYLIDNKQIDGASIDLTYGTAVVPEPISSILFVAGGTLLAVRRYFKRQKKE